MGSARAYSLGMDLPPVPERDTGLRSDMDDWLQVPNCMRCLIAMSTAGTPARPFWRSDQCGAARLL
jgi:hypothetical protein